MRSNNYQDITYKLLLISFFLAFLLNTFFHLIFDDFSNDNYEDLGGIVPAFSFILLSALFAISNSCFYYHTKHLLHQNENNLPLKTKNKFLFYLKKIDPYINPALSKTHVLLACLSTIFMLGVDSDALYNGKKINEPATISGLIINKMALLIFIIATSWAFYKDLDDSHLKSVQIGR